MLYFIISFHFILHLHETLEKTKKLICQQQISSRILAWRHSYPLFFEGIISAIARKQSSPDPMGTMYITASRGSILVRIKIAPAVFHRISLYRSQTLPIFKSSLVDYSMSWRIIRTRRLALDFPWGRRAGRFEHVYTPTHRHMRKARSLSTPRFLVRYLRYGGYIITH